MSLKTLLLRIETFISCYSTLIRTRGNPNVRCYTTKFIILFVLAFGNKSKISNTILRSRWQSRHMPGK